MSIKSTIKDGTGTGICAQVTSENALKVATVDHLNWSSYIQSFQNDTFGSNLAVNASPSGSPENVHNGTDNVYWTATALAGTWNFMSTTQAYDGTKSIDGTATVNNNTAQFAKGSNIDLSTYSAISGWIYISSWSSIGTKQITIQGWDSVGAVGTAVDIGAFVNKSRIGVWQKFTIPLTAFGLAGQVINALRVSTVFVGGGTPVDFFLDQIRILNAGSGPGVQVYTVNAVNGSIIRINKIAWNIIAGYDSSLANSAVPKLSYDDLLGISPETGFVYNTIQNNVIIHSVVVRNLLDLIEHAGAYLESVLYDGTNTYIKVCWDFPEPAELNYGTRDRLRITISDDLSGFEEINVRILGGNRSVLED